MSPALCDSTQLSSINFRGCCKIQLSEPDMDVLLRLPRLAHLCLASHFVSASRQALPPPALHLAVALLQAERPGLQIRWDLCGCGARHSELEAA